MGEAQRQVVKPKADCHKCERTVGSSAVLEDEFEQLFIGRSVQKHQRNAEEKDEKVEKDYGNHEKLLHWSEVVELKDLRDEVKGEYFYFPVEENEDEQSVNRVLTEQYRNPKVEQNPEEQIPQNKAQYCNRRIY